MKKYSRLSSAAVVNGALKVNFHNGPCGNKNKSKMLKLQNQ